MIKVYKLAGTSMRPLFKEGGVVLAESSCDKGALRPGDCVVYGYRGRVLLHRVLRISETGVFISDDAGVVSPHFVPHQDILGRVLSRNPLCGGPVGLLYSYLRRNIRSLVRK